MDGFDWVPRGRLLLAIACLGALLALAGCGSEWEFEQFVGRCGDVEFVIVGGGGFGDGDEFECDGEYGDVVVWAQAGGGGVGFADQFGDDQHQAAGH